MRRALLATALVLAACTTAADTTAETTPTTPATTPSTTRPTSPPTTAAAGESIGLVEGELGSYLADAGGNTLYVFLPDEAGGESTCYDACEANWPPRGAASAGAGVDETLLGTTTRTDGSVQATYGGWPLYYFAADAAPGDTNGQGVNDVWFVVGVDGTPLGAG